MKTAEKQKKKRSDRKMEQNSFKEENWKRKSNGEERTYKKRKQSIISIRFLDEFDLDLDDPDLVLVNDGNDSESFSEEEEEKNLNWFLPSRENTTWGENKQEKRYNLYEPNFE